MKLNRSTVTGAEHYPVRILQFGEGNFLRAFADWIVQKMNNEIGFNTGIDVVQPLAAGMADLLNSQEGLYHVYLKGIKNGEPVREFERIRCVNRAINPYADYETYYDAILNPQLRFVISNTTEAGIVYDASDRYPMQPQNSFPGKVTALLYERFRAFGGDESKGLIFFCCELIDRNGDMLKKYVMRHAAAWNLGEDFKRWVETSCAFCSTLVDRIVPGFPREDIGEIQTELGYADKLVVVGEYFHFWVIEAPEWVQRDFPAAKAGLQVKFVKDMTRYREQKVRVLNGAHTGSFAVSLLYGIETVRESVENLEIGRFMKEMVYEEILKGLNGNENELHGFASKILERFYNPYIRHLWTSIALNSLSKWETRCLPSLTDYLKNTGELPAKIVFSLAALLAYYRGENGGQSYQLTVDSVHLDFFSSLWAYCDDRPESVYLLTEQVLSNSRLWKSDLNKIEGLTGAVSSYLFLIRQVGMKEAVKSVLGKKEQSKKVA
jgi:tagaturonate reductase